MNPYACRLVLRPRSPLEVLDLGVRLVQTEGATLARLALVVLVPVWLAAVALGWWLDNAWLAAFAVVVIGPALQFPFTTFGARALFRRGVTVREVVRALPGQVGAAVAVVTSRALVMVGGLMLVGLLWPPLHALVQFLPETLVLERLPLGRALRRAGSLASDQMGKALVGSVASLALAMWIVVGVEAALQVLVAYVLQLGAPFGALRAGDCTPWVLLGLVLAQPAVALFRLLLYVDLRTVLEGWDLQVALRAAAEEA